MNEPVWSWPLSRVVDRILIERLADPLDQRAVNLALDDHRIDDAPEIVGAGETHERHAPGLAINLDLGNVGAGGISEIH